MLNSSEILRRLKPWIAFSQQYLYTLRERPDLTCFGLGSNAGGSSWGLQSNQKALAAFIIASYEDSIDWSDTGLTKEKVREEGLGMLRFTLETHLAGSHTCTDGTKWGHNWISTLGTSRMMHAVNAIWDELTDYDRELMKKVFISEADWLLNEYPVKAGLTVDNHPESNIWNGALLYQTACLYPDAPNAKAYKEKATRFFINGISKPEDEFSDVVYDGIKVKDAFVGANMFDSMACNHHGYMNVGYMVICLSNLAMLYFWCKDLGFPLPEAFDHHVIEAWELIRSCTFEDGRLWRIGGDTRVRYCYCQDYALPMWALMMDKYKIDCESLINNWLAQVDTEVENNGDGSFLSDRINYMKEDTPFYYVRLEGDRAVTISMLGWWLKSYALDGKTKSRELNSWYDEYHGSLMQKSDKRKASCTWIAAQRPSATFIPAAESSLAEWKHNLTGSVNSFGAVNNDKILSHKEFTFDGGFMTYGESLSESSRFYCEGYRFDNAARKTIAFALLPDDTTAISIQRAISPNRVYTKSYQRLQLRIPNDLYNGNKRQYFYEGGDIELIGGKHAKAENHTLGKWINVDGKMGVASTDDLTVKSPKDRQIVIVMDERTDRNFEHYGTLLTNDIVASFSDEHLWFNPGDEIYRTAFALNIGDENETKELAKAIEKVDTGSLVSLKVPGKDGKNYVLAVNFGEQNEIAEIPAGFAVLAGEKELAPGAAVLFVGE